MDDTFRTYQAFKTQYPKAVLLIQDGGFYVTFGDDALVMEQVCHSDLDLSHPSEEPKVEILRRTSPQQIAHLLEAGHTVAIADLTKDAPPSTEIERIVTSDRLTMPAETPHKYEVEPDGEILWAKDTITRTSRHKARA